MGSTARFRRPAGLATGADGLLYVVDGFELHPFSLRWESVRTVSLQGEVKTFGSIGVYTAGIGLDAAGNVYLANAAGVVRLGLDKRVTTLITIPATGVGSTIMGLTATPGGTVYYLEGNTVKKLTPDGVATLVAGDMDTPGSADGAGAQARFNFWGTEKSVSQRAGAMAIDSAGNLYLGDAFNHTVRKVTPAGVVTTVAGIPGVAGIQTGSPGGLLLPMSLALRDDKTLFVSSGNAILKISLP
jgi:hypothetical protein